MVRAAPRVRRPAFTAAYLEEEEEEYGGGGTGGADSDEDNGREQRRRMDDEEEVNDACFVLAVLCLLVLRLMGLLTMDTPICYAVGAITRMQYCSNHSRTSGQWLV